MTFAVSALIPKASCSLAASGQDSPCAHRMATSQCFGIRRADQPPGFGDAPNVEHGVAKFEGRSFWCPHDREMIANVCDELYLVHDGQCNIFDNDIAYYSQWFITDPQTAKKQANDIKKKLRDKKLADHKTDVS